MVARNRWLLTVALVLIPTVLSTGCMGASTPAVRGATPGPVPTVEVNLTATPTAGAGPAEILVRFMAARVERDSQVSDLLTQDFRGALATGQIDANDVYLYQAKDPCWYRYEVLGFEQTGPETATARVRVYEDYWGGDGEDSPPQSWTQRVTLARSASVWRVDGLGEPEGRREEPSEPHTSTISACLASRMKPTSVPTVEGR